MCHLYFKSADNFSEYLNVLKSKFKRVISQNEMFILSILVLKKVLQK